MASSVQTVSSYPYTCSGVCLNAENVPTNWSRGGWCEAELKFGPTAVAINAKKTARISSLHRRVVGRCKEHRIDLVDELAVLLGLGLAGHPLGILAELVPRLFAGFKARIRQ